MLFASEGTCGNGVWVVRSSRTPVREVCISHYLFRRVVCFPRSPSRQIMMALNRWFCVCCWNIAASHAHTHIYHVCPPTPSPNPFFPFQSTLLTSCAQSIRTRCKLRWSRLSLPSILGQVCWVRRAAWTIRENIWTSRPYHPHSNASICSLLW